jgi:hypothetical protein
VGSHGGRLNASSVAAPESPGALRRAAIVAAWGTVATTLLLAPIRLCLVATLFHVPCPGCGMTRAALALLHGDVARAFALHPLSIVLVPFVGTILVRQVGSYIRTGNAWSHRLPRWIEPVAAGLVVLLLGVWIARWCGALGGPVSV